MAALMRTKALLIGIQYKGSAWEELDGPHHDVKRMNAFLEDGPWQYGQIRILLDRDGYRRPDREGILESLRWLVEDATEDHRLFLHYSGHGDQYPTSSSSEFDGQDETIVPVDCPPMPSEEGLKGMIRDNVLREILVDPLPVGCHLTALFDCCHSGSMLDLRYCYPRYLSIPWAWKTAGPAYDSPRLNRTDSSKSIRKSTLPLSFEDTLPPDLEELRSPLRDPSLMLLQTPTPGNPYGLVEDTPRTSFLSLLTTDSRSVSLRADPMSFHETSGLGFGLGLDNIEIHPLEHLRVPTSTINIDTWRSGVSEGGFFDDNFVCNSPVMGSPTATISASSRRNSLMYGKSSFVQTVINKVARTGIRNTCYENEDIPSPFQSLKYSAPIRSRGTFAGFHRGPDPEPPAPRVCSLSACYDGQVVFEMGNGDGLLTTAFIHCVRERQFEITYGDLLSEMKKFFIKKNEARSSERLVEPPFPMLSSSFQLDLSTVVEI
ncbi:Ca(2+)-dependent cysteine protease [Serendipita sp. 396]|nr:Ca(2+)-dependent cysteine protease [Serendipita sp. 396]KAG8788764.1 Ca(2+)-dependent cysteine protease [Serendipita sp. 397]KAG8803892.1 Ca(2+)-dependent cysteine protease [Serendipita sp. 398]KAG8858318.1 Ca(2+)-dependent cysteine protease [Serendipita sp. 411]KAG8876002.1 Ca(2+)-dependent cysteine protease [Serendipita sp. 405]